MYLTPEQALLLHAIVACHNMHEPTAASLQLEQILNYLVAEFVILPKQENGTPDRTLP